MQIFFGLIIAVVFTLFVVGLTALSFKLIGRLFRRLLPH
jgi:hypothetical protein